MSLNDYTRAELEFVINDIKNKSAKDTNRVMCLMLHLWTNYPDFVQEHNNSGGMFDIATIRIGVAVLIEKAPEYRRIGYTVEMFKFSHKKLFKGLV